MDNTAALLDVKVKALVSSYVPSGELLNELVHLFSTFSDQTRLRIVSALAISEMCVTELSTVLLLNQTTVSHQLRLLKSMGAVTYRRAGKSMYYTLKSGIINDIVLKGVEFLGN